MFGFAALISGGGASGGGGQLLQERLCADLGANSFLQIPIYLEKQTAHFVATSLIYMESFVLIYMMCIGFDIFQKELYGKLMIVRENLYFPKQTHG